MILKPIDNPYLVWGATKKKEAPGIGETNTKGVFIGVYEDEKIAGAFLVKAWNEHCFEIHGGVHPDFWGRGVEVCEFMGWQLFLNTPCLKIVAVIPEFNRLMIRCVKKIGMEQEGILKKACLKDMKLHDLFVYGMTKTQYREGGRLCQQQ